MTNEQVTQITQSLDGIADALNNVADGLRGEYTEGTVADALNFIFMQLRDHQQQKTKGR